jgi:hypothetical protein
MPRRSSFLVVFVTALFLLGAGLLFASTYG